MEWVISVCSVVVFNVLITLILPSGKLNTYVSFILSILLVFVMIRPIFSIDISKIFDQVASTNNIIIDYDFLSYINQLKAQEKEEDCIKLLNSEGYEVEKITIEYNKENYEEFDIKKVKIFLNYEVINSNISHIDINDGIKTLISKYLETDKGVVYVITE